MFISKEQDFVKNDREVKTQKYILLAGFHSLPKN